MNKRKVTVVLQGGPFDGEKVQVYDYENMIHRENKECHAFYDSQGKFGRLVKRSNSKLNGLDNEKRN